MILAFKPRKHFAKKESNHDFDAIVLNDIIISLTNRTHGLHSPHSSYFPINQTVVLSCKLYEILFEQNRKQQNKQKLKATWPSSYKK